MQYKWTFTKHFTLSTATVACRIWWCPGPLLDCMPPTKFKYWAWSGVWWSWLLDIRCLWRHNMTSYSRLQINVLVKFVDTTYILFYTHSPYSYNVSLYQPSTLGDRSKIQHSTLW